MKFRGAKVTIHGVVDSADLKDTLYAAWLDLQKVKLTQDGEYKSATRGGLWRVISHAGIERIEIFGKVEKVTKQAVRRVKVIKTRIKYIPAFHTFDSGGNFIGLTLCTTGRWGSPYKYIKCKEEDILSFADGLWNIDENASKPDPNEYKKKDITTSYRDEDDKVEYWDMPATHEYTSGSVSGFVEGSGGSQWTSDKQSIFLMCESVEAHGYNQRPYTMNYAWKYMSGIIVWTDWSKYNDEQPIVDKSENFTGRYGNVIVKGATASSYSPTGDPNACVTVTDNLNSSTENWSSLLSNHYTHTNNIFWNVNEPQTGVIFYADDYWGTFRSVDKADGCYFTGVTNSNYTYYSATTKDTSIGELPNFHVVSSSNYGIDLSTAYEKITVFGKDYIVKDFPESYYNADNKIYIANPRIYFPGDKQIALASTIREDDFEFEYMCFNGDIEQYNDADAKYEYSHRANNYWLHEIPVNTGDGDAYGNGEFSLIKVKVSEEEEMTENVFEGAM